MSNNPKIGGSLVSGNPLPSSKQEFGATPDRKLAGPRGSSLAIGQHSTMNDGKPLQKPGGANMYHKVMHSTY